MHYFPVTLVHYISSMRIKNPITRRGHNVQKQCLAGLEYGIMECQDYPCQGTGTCRHFRKPSADRAQSCGLELVFSHAWASLRSCRARRALQPSKNPFLDTLKAVVIDIRFFLFLLLLTVWGFACAFYILFRRDQSKHVRPCYLSPALLPPSQHLSFARCTPRFRFAHSHLCGRAGEHKA